MTLKGYDEMIKRVELCAVALLSIMIVLCDNALCQEGKLRRCGERDGNKTACFVDYYDSDGNVVLTERILLDHKFKSTQEVGRTQELKDKIDVLGVSIGVAVKRGYTDSVDKVEQK